MLLNSKWVGNKIKEKIERYPKTNENENNNDLKSMERSESGPKREIYSNTGLRQETNKQKSQTNNLILQLIELEN